MPIPPEDLQLKAGWGIIGVDRQQRLLDRDIVGLAKVATAPSPTLPGGWMDCIPGHPSAQAHYRPLNLGSRFSTKARSASTKSSVPTR